MIREVRNALLDKLEMLKLFNQRSGRELWADKPREIQDMDIENADTILSMAISALSKDGEYIKKKDAIEEFKAQKDAWEYYGESFYNEKYIKFDNVIQSINDMPTYSFPNSAENKKEVGYISIDDVMSVFDDFMCGEVDEEGTNTFLEMLKDKVESEGENDSTRD